MPRQVNPVERAATQTAIKDAARSLMAANSTAGLSLRAIAREVGLSAPSLYHYYASLDDLITALIVDAFNALADSLHTARAAVRSQHPARQMMAVIEAYRRYALDHPTDFQLIYGNPIPGYVAPVEVTVPASTRTLVVFTEVMVELLASGAMDVPAAYRRIPAETEAALRAAAEFAGYEDLDPLALYLVMAGWPQIHGHVVLDLLGHFGPTVGDTGLFFREQMRHMLRGMGVDLARLQDDP